MFKNKSAEVGIEPMFTDSMVRRFERSQVAHVVGSENAPVKLEGVITRVETIPGAALDITSKTAIQPATNLASNVVVMTTDYRLRVTAEITLKRKSDDKVIWQGGFANEKIYNSPRIGTPVVNSADATYNQSARMAAISQLAEEMMQEAHDRITENF